MLAAGWTFWVGNTVKLQLMASTTPNIAAAQREIRRVASKDLQSKGQLPGGCLPDGGQDYPSGLTILNGAGRGFIPLQAAEAAWATRRYKWRRHRISGNAAAVNPWDSMLIAGIIDLVAGAKVVGAINHQIVRADPCR